MFENFTDEQLKKELKRREDEREKQERIKQEKARQSVIDNIDLFLTVCPEHDRTSCSDDNPCNAHRTRCLRCALLHVKKHGYMVDDFVVTVTGTTLTPLG